MKINPEGGGSPKKLSCHACGNGTFRVYGQKDYTILVCTHCRAAYSTKIQ